jgi:hypothetical protein
MVVKHSVVREGPASFNVTISVFAWSGSSYFRLFFPPFSLCFVPSFILPYIIVM